MHNIELTSRPESATKLPVPAGRIATLTECSGGEVQRFVRLNRELPKCSTSQDSDGWSQSIPKIHRTLNLALCGRAGINGYP